MEYLRWFCFDSFIGIQAVSVFMYVFLSGISHADSTLPLLQ